MFRTLKPFVHSDYCLSCRECCVFQRANSVWGPHVAASELNVIERAAPLDRVITLDGCRLKTAPLGDRHRCVLLDPSEHHCRAYAVRPFECRLYPFLISSENSGVRIYAHLSCRFVQDNLNTPFWMEHVAYLKAFFSSSSRAALLLGQSGIYPDFSSFKDQIQWLFDVEVPTSDGSGLMARKEEIESWLARRPRSNAAMSFANLFLWQDFFEHSFEEVDGNLCVFASQPGGTFLYWPPLGTRISPKAVEYVFDRMRKINRGSGVTRIDQVGKEDVAFFDPARYTIREQTQEFLYPKKDIVSLSGGGYKAKRHDINLFSRTRRPEFRPYLPTDRDGCRQLLDLWLDNRRGKYDDDIYRYMLEDNRKVHERVLTSADALELIGRVVIVDGRIAGYTFGYPLNDRVFCDLLEVADPGISGLAAFLFHEFAGDEVLKPFDLINAMDDFGMPNITKTKFSWRPGFLEPVYTVTEKEIC